MQSVNVSAQLQSYKQQSQANRRTPTPTQQTSSLAASVSACAERMMMLRCTMNNNNANYGDESRSEKTENLKRSEQIDDNNLNCTMLTLMSKMTANSNELSMEDLNNKFSCGQNILTSKVEKSPAAMLPFVRDHSNKFNNQNEKQTASVASPLLRASNQHAFSQKGSPFKIPCSYYFDPLNR
jgi:hypothetical protein